MDWNSIVSGLISGLITGTLTCGVFYWLAGRDLKREASDLRKLNVLVINALVQAGLADVSVDAQGHPVGLRLKLDVGAETVTLSESAAVLLHPPVSGEGGEPLISPRD